METSEDGFLNIIRSTPGIPLQNGQFAVMFTPTTHAGAMKPQHHCKNLGELKTFLVKLGLTIAAIDTAVTELNAQYRSMVPLALTQDKIALI